MSMQMNILKKGVADSLQDAGRYGFQSIGIPPCGYMDYLSAQLANLILGNPIQQTEDRLGGTICSNRQPRLYQSDDG